MLAISIYFGRKTVLPVHVKERFLKLVDPAKIILYGILKTAKSNFSYGVFFHILEDSEEVIFKIKSMFANVSIQRITGTEV